MRSEAPEEQSLQTSWAASAGWRSSQSHQSLQYPADKIRTLVHAIALIAKLSSPNGPPSPTCPVSILTIRMTSAAPTSRAEAVLRRASRQQLPIRRFADLQSGFPSVCVGAISPHLMSSAVLLQCIHTREARCCCAATLALAFLSPTGWIRAGLSVGLDCPA